MNPDAKVIRAKLRRNGYGGMVVLLEVHCPICGKIHTHGGGESLEGARAFLGHRAAHCADKLPTNHGYVLTDPDGLLVDRIPLSGRPKSVRTPVTKVAS